MNCQSVITKCEKSSCQISQSFLRIFFNWFFGKQNVYKPFVYVPSSLGNFLLEKAICIEEAIHVAQYIYYILERNLPKVWTLVLRRMLHTFTWDHNKVTCTAASFLLDYLVLEVASKLLNWKSNWSQWGAILSWRS